MNRPNELRTVFVAVDLARESDFALGPLLVRPSLRKIVRDGREEAVQPRVMQVLVALARSHGGVVSREELIETCWDGIVVGDDSITHSIAKVRQLAEYGGTQAFEVETIPRVGYRLIRNPATDLSPASTGRAPLQPDAGPQIAAAGAAAARFVRDRFRLLVIFAALAGAVVVIAFVLMPKPTAQWSVVESHQPFISTPDIERFPSFSPDGTMIAYSRGRNAWSRQIFLQLRRGGEPLQLTHDDTDDVSPAVSPDGTSVAYVAATTNQPCRIMLAQIPSGPSRQIGRCRLVERSSLAWERGGHALFYEDRMSADQLLHIMRYDIETGALAEITRSGEAGSLGDFQPAESPDGRTLLFMRYVKGDRLQVVLRTLGNGSERILVDDIADKYAVWSNDSSTVFVSSNEGSDSSILAYAVSGAAPWRITSNARPMEFLSAGPDGLLAVELKNKVTQLTAMSIGNGAEPHPLDTDGFSGCSFDYAADGTFALITNNGESPIIAVGAPGHLREILRLKTRPPCGIRWSPDGTRLAFGGGDSDSLISVITRAGLPVAQVPYPTVDFGDFEWTPDGKAFLQDRRDSRGWRVWRVNLAPPHEAEPILPYGWNSVRMHHGMLLGRKEGSSGVWRIDGSPKRLTDGPSRERTWAWTTAGDRIVYSSFSNPDHPQIVSQPLGDGPRVTTDAGGLDDLSILAVNPVTAEVTYNRIVRDDPDIGWLRLVRR